MEELEKIFEKWSDESADYFEKLLKESYLKGREDEREKILEIVKKQKSIMESYKMYICTKCSTISREPAEICPECGNKPYDSKLFVWHYAVDGTMVFSLLTNLENQIKRLDEE